MKITIIIHTPADNHLTSSVKIFNAFNVINIHTSNKSSTIFPKHHPNAQRQKRKPPTDTNPRLNTNSKTRPRTIAKVIL